MEDTSEHTECSNKILLEYQLIKNELGKNDVIICQHIGSFTQGILISIVSLVERAMIQTGESIRLQKRINYLIIETLQNIISHADKLSDENQLAYLFISKNKKGYTIHTSNTIKNTNIKVLETQLAEFLNVKPKTLSKILASKIQQPKIDEEGRGGLGLISIINKSKNGFMYDISKGSKNYSLLHIKLDIHYKNFR